MDALPNENKFKGEVKVVLETSEDRKKKEDAALGQVYLLLFCLLFIPSYFFVSEEFGELSSLWLFVWTVSTPFLFVGLARLVMESVRQVMKYQLNNEKSQKYTLTIAGLVQPRGFDFYFGWTRVLYLLIGSLLFYNLTSSYVITFIFLFIGYLTILIISNYRFVSYLKAKYG